MERTAIELNSKQVYIGMTLEDFEKEFVSQGKSILEKHPDSIIGNFYNVELLGEEGNIYCYFYPGNEIINLIVFKLKQPTVIDGKNVDEDSDEVCEYMEEAYARLCKRLSEAYGKFTTEEPFCGEIIRDDAKIETSLGREHNSLVVAFSRKQWR